MRERIGDIPRTLRLLTTAAGDETGARGVLIAGGRYRVAPHWTAGMRWLETGRGIRARWCAPFGRGRERGESAPGRTYLRAVIAYPLVSRRELFRPAGSLHFQALVRVSLALRLVSVLNRRPVASGQFVPRREAPWQSGSSLDRMPWRRGIPVQHDGDRPLISGGTQTARADWMRPRIGRPGLRGARAEATGRWSAGGLVPAAVKVHLRWGTASPLHGSPFSTASLIRLRDSRPGAGWREGNQTRNRGANAGRWSGPGRYFRAAVAALVPVARSRLPAPDAGADRIPRRMNETVRNASTLMLPVPGRACGQGTTTSGMRRTGTPGEPAPAITGAAAFPVPRLAMRQVRLRRKADVASVRYRPVTGVVRAPLNVRERTGASALAGARPHGQIRLEAGAFLRRVSPSPARSSRAAAAQGMPLAGRRPNRRSRGRSTPYPAQAARSEMPLVRRTVPASTAASYSTGASAGAARQLAEDVQRIVRKEVGERMRPGSAEVRRLKDTFYSDLGSELVLERERLRRI